MEASFVQGATVQQVEQEHGVRASSTLTHLTISSTTFFKARLRDKAALTPVAVEPVDELFKRMLTKILRLNVIYAKVRKVDLPWISTRLRDPRFVDEY